MDPKASGIIRKYGLDHVSCDTCSFEVACLKNAIDPQVVKKELIDLRITQQETQTSFILILEDVLRQHENVKHAIPQVSRALIRATQQSTLHKQSFQVIRDKFEALVENLEVHLYKEENILFPEFNKLWKKRHCEHGYPLLFPMMYPIQGLEAEHESARWILQEICLLIRLCNNPKLTNKYSTSVFQEVQAIKNQMMKLFDQESRLFPQALALEKETANN